jgi:hypothetical protein
MFILLLKIMDLFWLERIMDYTDTKRKRVNWNLLTLFLQMHNVRQLKKIVSSVFGFAHRIVAFIVLIEIQ